MSKIILQPSGNKGSREHYADTIENNVSLETIRPHATVEEFAVLQEIYPSQECKVWGVTPGGSNITKWNRISIGDVTLFSRDKAIYASAVTTYKIHSHGLAELLWGFNDKRETWEYIYFLDEVKSHSIPYIDFNRAVGYADNFVIQGFSVLKPDQSIAVFESFDLQSETFIESIDEKQYDDILAKLDALKETETEIIATRRLEQGFLKQHLFGNRTVETCACCQKELPVSFLVTAHIKKRAFCTFDEKRDLNVVMPMCKLGCDELFERGFIGVRDGEFIAMGKQPASNDLQFSIDQVENNQCEFYTDKSKDYFDWHINHHRLK